VSEQKQKLSEMITAIAKSERQRGSSANSVLLLEAMAVQAQFVEERAEKAERRLAVLEESVIDGNHGEWYVWDIGIEPRVNWATLKDAADAIIKAQGEGA
jgi:hypothetical protein